MSKNGNPKKRRNIYKTNLEHTMRVLDRIGMTYRDYQRLSMSGKAKIVGDQLVEIK